MRSKRKRKRTDRRSSKKNKMLSTRRKTRPSATKVNLPRAVSAKSVLKVAPIVTICRLATAAANTMVHLTTRPDALSVPMAATGAIKMPGVPYALTGGSLISGMENAHFHD